MGSDQPAKQKKTTRFANAERRDITCTFLSSQRHCVRAFSHLHWGRHVRNARKREGHPAVRQRSAKHRERQIHLLKRRKRVKAVTNGRGDRQDKFKSPRAAAFHAINKNRFQFDEAANLVQREGGRAGRRDEQPEDAALLAVAPSGVARSTQTKSFSIIHRIRGPRLPPHFCLLWDTRRCQPILRAAELKVFATAVARKRSS